MANVEQRTSKSGKKTYRVKVRLRGFPVQMATFDRKTDAKKWAQDTESDLRNNRHFKNAEAKKHTLGEVVDRFIRDELPKLPKVKPIMESQLRWWKRQIGYKTLADLSAPDIREYRDKLLRDGTSRKAVITPATVNRYLTALSLALSTASGWGWMGESPMREGKIKLEEPRGRVRFLDEEERRRLLAACRESPNPCLYLIVVLALSTGARSSELKNLRWPDVDVERGLAVLEETKNGERRSLPLRGHALELIREHAKVRRLDTDLLFPSQRDPLKSMNIRNPWVKSVKAAGINDFRFHDLRHCAASYLAMNGASLAEIAEVLGHKTLQMVKRYAHLSEAHTAGVVERMNKSIFG